MKRYILTVPLLSITTAVLLNPAKASADEVSVGIYPPVSDISLSPGETKTLQFQLKNNHNESVVLTPLFQPFKASNDKNGVVSYQSQTPAFFRNLHVLVDGAPVETIEVGALEEKSITLEIRTPISEQSNDYYFSLIMMTVPNQIGPDQSNTGITAYSTLSSGIASHVLVAINPEPARNIQLTEFTTPFLSQNTPHTFHAEITNQSSSYSRIYGELSVKDVFGNVIEKVIIPETRVLSQSTRQLTSGGDKSNQTDIVVEEALLPGVYRAEILVHGDGMQSPITKTIYFNVTPLPLVLTLLFIIILGYLLKRRMKRHMS